MKTRAPSREYQYLMSSSFSTSRLSTPRLLAHLAQRRLRAALAGLDVALRQREHRAALQPHGGDVGAAAHPPHHQPAGGELAHERRPVCHSSSLTSGTKRTAASTSSFAVADPDEMLAVGPPYRADQAAVRRELVDQRPRRLALRRGGYRDRVEGSAVGGPERPVAHADLRVVAAQLAEERLRLVGERDVALDRHQLAAEKRENGGRVAGPGADLENQLVALELERLGHGRDDPGLRDGLARADRQRAVAVRAAAVDAVGRTARGGPAASPPGRARPRSRAGGAGAPPCGAGLSRCSSGAPQGHAR